jgi:hypothetical protein
MTTLAQLQALLGAPNHVGPSPRPKLENGVNVFDFSDLDMSGPRLATWACDRDAPDDGCAAVEDGDDQWSMLYVCQKHTGIVAYENP